MKNKKNKLYEYGITSDSEEEKNFCIKHLKNKSIIIVIICIIIYTIYIFYPKETPPLPIPEKIEIYQEFLPLKNNFTDSKGDIINFNTSYKVKYEYSLKFHMIKVEYKVSFFSENQNLISPYDINSDNKYRIFCHMKIDNINPIISMPLITENKYFSCIEFIDLKDNVNFGIKIVDNLKGKDLLNINLFDQKIFHIKNSNDNKNDYLFDHYAINENYIRKIKQYFDPKINETLKFKKSYFRYPHFTFKRHYIENKWDFINIFDNYFCYCKGTDCININVTQYCKYYSYMYTIDKNRNAYNKTDYLFIDFIFAELSSDDVFPVFERMYQLNYPVHYMTENEDIYKRFCPDKNNCSAIIKVTKDNYIMNGDFLETYLQLFLKFKALISGRSQKFNYASNIFFNLEYVTYIAVGHGISYLKYFLYDEYESYGIKQNDKILIPPSDKMIYFAKKYGWTDDRLIKFNLPRWDKYSAESFPDSVNKYNNSIYILFTWRDLQKKKFISPSYFSNIISLIFDQKLYEALKEKKVNLYISIHHLMDKYIEKYRNMINKKEYIHYLPDNEISKCLTKTNLVVTDFSSIIFDLMYRGYPFVMYLPDANTYNMEEIYTKNYYDLIQSLKNGTLEFENKFFNREEAIDKIIYYINNNFELDEPLKKFYASFQLERKNSINDFIKYLDNL